MSQQCFSLIRGRAARLTKLDGCGVVVPGSQSSVVTEGIISVGVTANTEEGEAINVTNANGDTCVSDTPAPKLINYGVEISFCKVNPVAFKLTTGQSLVKRPGTGVGSPADYIGFKSNTKVDLSAVGFALELWSNVPSSACASSGVKQYGYLLLPFIQNGVVGDFSWENAAINFSVTGAVTKDGAGWGLGPYNVMNGAGASEVQTVTITGTPTGGTFTLGFGGDTTDGIAYNATAAAVQTALRALDTIGDDGVNVTGGPGPGTPYVVTFAGPLAAQAVPLLDKTAALTGGTTPNVTVVETTPGSSGGAGPLSESIDPYDHLQVILTEVAPPTEVCGWIPVGVEATTATQVAGANATLSPANSYAPWDVTDANTAVALTASPASAWSAGSYLLTESGQKIHYNGTTWVSGIA